MKTLIDLLRENARLTNEQLAVLLDKTLRKLRQKSRNWKMMV